MDDLELYKSIYDRELGRRINLDNAINIPIGIISVLVSLIYYFSSNINIVLIGWKYVFYIFVTISSLLILVSIYYLIKSYNNLFRGFDYHNFPTTDELRKYQLELVKYNTKVESENQILFSQYLIDKYVSYADDHIRINDKRAFCLYISKSFFIAAILILLILFILFLIFKFQ